MKEPEGNKTVLRAITGLKDADLSTLIIEADEAEVKGLYKTATILRSLANILESAYYISIVNDFKETVKPFSYVKDRELIGDSIIIKRHRKNEI